MARFLVPLGVFIVMVAFLFVGLHRDPHMVPSPLIDKPAPEFTLRQLHRPDATFSSADMKGKVWLLNVWASWCLSCRVEHPLVMELSKTGEVPIYGLDYKDDDLAGKGWLAQWGNPYVMSLVDADGRVGIDFGVYGVPETFLIDKEGVIRYKQIGPLTREVINETILPMVRELSG